MALFYQHNINEGTRTGIWQIEEQEDFFLEKVPVKRDVSHPYKRLQHLAGRFLLPALFEDFPMNDILVADTRKPFLENEQYHFSISHCGNYAAAIVSNHQQVGVDIELVTPRIISISDKFLHPDEKVFLNDWQPLSKIYLDLATVLWCAKESVFKWYGKGGVDFRQHIRLNGDILFGENNKIELPFLFLKEGEMPITVHARLMNQLVLAFLYT